MELRRFPLSYNKVELKLHTYSIHKLTFQQKYIHAHFSIFYRQITQKILNYGSTHILVSRVCLV